MADNTTINPASGGDVIATDDLTTLNGGAVSGVKAQRVKVGWGSDASLRDVDASFPLPTTDSAFGTDGASPPSITGTGVRGWLRGIYEKLSGTVAVSQASPPDLATTLTNGRKTVTTPGTPLALAASTAVKWVTVTALPTNTALVAVGASGVVAAAGSTTTGILLDAGASATIPVDNLSKVFVDARVAAEGVTFLAGA